MRQPVLSQAAGDALASMAAWVVGARLAGLGTDPQPPEHPELQEIGASFVTLVRRGQLRGCLGTLDAWQPLYLDVAEHALAAMNDPRLAPVTAEEWPQLDVSVSVLSQPVPMAASGYEALVAQLRVGTDGLILTDGRHRATFLPVVWRKLVDPAQFVAALLAKGGWDLRDADRLTALRYTAVEFESRSPRPPLDQTYQSDPVDRSGGPDAEPPADRTPGT